MSDCPFTEHLHRIVDRRIESKSHEEEVPDRSISFEAWAERNRKREEEKLRTNVELIHDLGLKCDSVGWCSLDLNRRTLTRCWSGSALLPGRVVSARPRRQPRDDGGLRELGHAGAVFCDVLSDA